MTFPDTEVNVLDRNSLRFRSSFLAIHPRQGATVTAPVDAVPPTPSRGPEAWAARVREFGIEAEPGSDRYQVALMLLASVEIGQNIDRLARRTSTPRPLAAKCARRLVDNGVWVDGRTVGKWTNDPLADSEFERDVAVGLGHLLRRVGADGRMEWAEAGRWNKNFEADDDDEVGTGTTYVDAAPRGLDPVPLAEDLEPVRASTPSPSVRPEAAVKPATSTPPSAPPVATPPAPDAGVDSDGVEDDDGADAPSLEQVFSDAVWLR